MAAIDLGLTGRSVLILGAGEGLGEQSALLLADAGCLIAVADLELERAGRVRSLLADRGTRSLALALDVTDDTALANAVERVDSELGNLYGLVTIVGGSSTWSSITETTGDQWDHDFRLNLRYFFVAGREVARSLIRRGAPGSMVCVSSIDGFRAAGYHAAYGASKAGMISLVKSMAAEWGPLGIRVNSVAPGSTITPTTPDIGEADIRPGRAPLRRRGTANEIAKAVLFLMSDLASYVTGHTLPVDGGLMAIGPFPFGPSPSDHVLASQVESGRSGD
jgi:NAD(P)-dependent dehydrogenase (short-subunit alcohol dehydrogenase family)